MRAIATAIFGTMLLCAAAHADERALFARACEAAKSKRPVAVEVHVALCDNRVIPCGSRKLGDGDDLATNLYWGTSEGLFGWMKAHAGPWRLTRRTREGLSADVLERVVWTRTVTPNERWRACGVNAPFDVEMTVDAWRGIAIDGAIAAFVSTVARSDALVVAYVGHNRWMDIERFAWPKADARTAPKAVIAIACYSREYLKPWIVAAGQTALVLTNDFVMASGAAAVGAIDAFFDGATLAKVRQRATQAYARGQGKDPARLSKVFVNETSPRW